MSPRRSRSQPCLPRSCRRAAQRRPAARLAIVLPWLAIAACGGGGGGGAAVTPALNTVRLSAATSPLPGGAVELLVSLADEVRVQPALLQVAIDLPAQLQLPAADRLLPARPLVTLDGDLVDGTFVVLCGDAVNRAAATLGAGPLFRVRLQPTLPQTAGTFQVRLREVRAASVEGSPVATPETPLSVPVTLQD